MLPVGMAPIVIIGASGMFKVDLCVLCVCVCVCACVCVCVEEYVMLLHVTSFARPSLLKYCEWQNQGGGCRPD